MHTATQSSPDLNAILNAAKRGQLSRQLADTLHALGAAAVALFALAMAAQVAALQRNPAVSLGTPWGMVPVNQKPAVKGRKKKPGARAGHPGRRRQTPPQIDARVEHRLEVCPCCGGEL